MSFGVFLCVIAIILVGADVKMQKKRNVWFTYVDDYGNPIPPENTYSKYEKLFDILYILFYLTMVVI